MLLLLLLLLELLLLLLLLVVGSHGQSAQSAQGRRSHHWADRIVDRRQTDVPPSAGTVADHSSAAQQHAGWHGPHQRHGRTRQ
jgi:hypothetical protein